jgi:uncharacterized protein (DUF983 family)
MERGLRRTLRLIMLGLRLRCPRCSAQTLFRNWWTMHTHCMSCGMRFEREQGYFLGAMYVNYAFTVLIVISGYLLLEWWTDLSLTVQLVLWISVSLICPLLLFRQARGVWLSFDYIFNPITDERSDRDEEW